MRFGLSVLLASTIFLNPAHAQNKEVKRGPEPKWVSPSELMTVPEDAKGVVFVRRQDTLVRLDKDGQKEYAGYRIKILHPNALQLGNISILWNPAAESPTVHILKIHRGSETIDILNKAKFEILRREDQLETAMLDGMLTAVFRLADLRVGDELEFSFTTSVNDPTIGKNNSGILFVGVEPPKGRFRLGLSWDEGQKPDIKMTPDIASAAEQGPETLDIRFDNPAMAAPPKDAPPRYNWQRVLEFSDFRDWPTISRHFAPLYSNAAKLNENSPLKREAIRIAATHSTPMDKARAALKLVQEDIRYIYVGLDGGNLMPASAEETWQRRYGDCKAKTAILMALLNELGVSAEAVFVNNNGADDGMDEKLPNPYMFDHVLVKAQIDGKAYWLDGTLPAVATPSVEPVLPYRWTLPLTAQGSSLTPLELQPARKPDEITLHEIDAREGFDRPAGVINTTILRGIKGIQQQAQMSTLTQDQLLNGFRQQLTGDTWQTIDDVRWHYDAKAQVSILTIQGKGKVDWDNDGGGAKSMSLPGGGFNPPERRVRSADQKQDVPYYTIPEYSCDVTTVRLPTQTKAENWWFNTSFDTRMFGRNFYRTFELRDGAIRMIRGSRIEMPEIDAATAARDNERIASFDNSMAWIYFDPSNNEPGEGKSSRVPATYEIDWTEDDVPCLSSTVGD